MAEDHHQNGKRRAALCRISPAGLGFIFRHEAIAGVSNHLHWPGGSSGVTLGPGYDMKERSKHTIVSDMLRLGVPGAIAGKIAEGSKLAGGKAEQFANNNKLLVSLTNAQEAALLGLIAPHYESIVRRNVHAHLAQHEFDALFSFVYNPGGSFLPVAHFINNRKVAEAMDVIRCRVFTGHSRSRGLFNRRIDEIRLFEYGEYFARTQQVNYEPARC